MSDNAPDEAGGMPPGGGSRRSGLDRLRATRGSAEEPTGADRPAPASASASDATSEAERRPAGVLLDEPRDTDSAAGTTSAGPEAAEESAGDRDGRSDGSKGRRARRRAAAVAAGTTASTADVADGHAPSTPRAGGSAGSKRATATTSAPASPRQKVAALLLGLIIIGLLVPVVLMRHRIVGQTAEEKAVTQLVDKRTAALATARQFAVTFFSPDYKKIDDYNKQVLAGTTGAFNQDFASKQADLKSLVTKAQSQATGRILTAGVSKVSGDDVEVLVVADQDVQNALTKGKVTTIRTRVRITVHKTVKGWLVSGFEPVT